MAHPTSVPTLDKLWPQPSRVSTKPPTTINSVDIAGTTAVLAEVHREFLEKERRKPNVVVSGLKEQDGIDDINAFLDLCEECLPVKPLVIREGSRRLGRKVAGKIRPLLITLSSETSASELLQCARLLRQSTAANGVYANAGLTPAESLAAFQERERRRARRSTGTQANSGLGSSTVSGEVDNSSSSSSAYVSQVRSVPVFTPTGVPTAGSSQVTDVTDSSTTAIEQLFTVAVGSGL